MGAMGNESAQVRINQSCEKEILAVSRSSYLVRKSKQGRPAWYGPILARLGDMLVESSTRLNSITRFNMRIAHIELEDS
jgi:hypothetical protein